MHGRNTARVILRAVMGRDILWMSGALVLLHWCSTVTDESRLEG
jgi:hypothetical protein